MKKWGHQVRLGEKRAFISLNSSAFIENLSSFEHARANHTKSDVQKGCTMQLNGITLINYARSL